MKKAIASILFAFLCISVAMAQDSEEFIAKQYVTKKGDTLLYRMLYPADYGSQKKYPLVIFLHGAGERGNDNKKQLTHGSDLFLKEDVLSNYPAIVVFPQCPESDFWSSVKITREEAGASFDFDYPDDPTKSLELVMDLTTYLTKMEAVDEKRIYVMGLSMGGMGTFELLARQPKKFAAAVPICGGGNPEDCEKYAERVPLWVFHGARDNIVRPEYSREMVDELKRLEADVTYTEYPEAGHESWENAFAEPDLLKWLFSKEK
ncbi:phospholipase/carboxylesterase [Anseongella ginsenosidimutans]|uniref:Phospholipase/carboxylesterase n=1 Tax=Anseongella ginsenosidimutans TaxID=496056 RepID=A0A4R3KQG5_9SPHI|nr:prolyl oligopeptidase family serine peptidase [Anseongella ginsenosidimutans]TCS85685.1 phospholipase/carboxylesterase [Anseongella ginsenosidimutans]